MEPPAKRAPLALIATDVEWVSRSIESVLATRGFSIVRAYTGEQAIERARKLAPDLIILNAHLPDGSGVNVCRSLRQEVEILPFTPILLTTPGPRTRVRRLEALAAGAWDYLPLPLDVEELWMRVDNYMRGKLAADRGWGDGLIDLETGLYNERGLLRRAHEVGSDAYRHARPLSCVIFGPEDRGRRSGVMVPGNRDRMEQLVDVFRASGRVSDVVGRVRAAEFMVLAPATDPIGATRLAERMLRRLEGNGTARGEYGLQIRAGIYGVDNFRRAGIDVTTLISRASMALARAHSDDGAEKIFSFE